jgi:glycosyltransferase involved in cell wall biosynthesis
MSKRPFRVLAIASHPVQYHGPLYRRMATCAELDLHVAYCSLRGAEPNRDPEFDVTVQWDVPLLDGYKWTHVPNVGSGDESFFGLRNPGIWKLIREGNFDAVLCFVGYVRATFWIACLAARSCRAAFLFGCDQGSLEPRDGQWWKGAVKGLGWPLLYRLADQVLVSSSRARQLIHSLGIREEHISLTLLVVDNEWWRRKADEVDRRVIRESWGVTENDVVLLFCAKLQPWKRPFDLLRAFANLRRPDSILLLVGDGSLRSQLESEASYLGVASQVRFLGFLNQSQLPAIYKSADLMVLPSAYEPFGVVVNEAMCCGCPVVVSDRVGAGPDLIAPVDNSFIFPCGDVDALTRLLSTAVADRSRLREVGRRCISHMQSWSPERSVAATIEAIERAVSRMQPRTPEESRVSTSKSSVSGTS